MSDMMRIGRSALISGTVASLVSSVLLAGLAVAEGKSAVQPVNATSHWLHGDGAGAIRSADAPHTLLGYLTHHASAMFWAVFFEALRSTRLHRTDRLLQDAATVSAIAGIVDYGLVPKRATPGWEEVLSNRSVAGGFAALAIGLMLGGLLSNSD